MSQTQSIIVYRNPMEQQLWEGAGNNPGIILYVLAMMIISVFVIWLCQGPILEHINRRTRSSFQMRNSRTRTAGKGVGLMWTISLAIIAICGYNLSFLMN